MSAKNCPICGKIFNDKDGNESVCMVCLPFFNDSFDKVRDVLYSHPEYNIVQVSVLTGVSIPLIKLYILEGRLGSTKKTEGVS